MISQMMIIINFMAKIILKINYYYYQQRLVDYRI